MHVALQNHEQQLNVVEITQPTKNGIKRREVPQYLLKVKNITTNAEQPQMNIEVNMGAKPPH